MVLVPVDQVVKFGPWPAGMDCRQYPVEGPEQACSVIQNMDVLDDGSLISRRPFYIRRKSAVARAGRIQYKTLGLFHTYGSATNNSLTKWGVFAENDTAALTAQFVGTYGPSEYIFKTAAGNISRAGNFTTSFEYNGLLYLVPGTSGAGVGFNILWTASNPRNNGVVTDVPNMPKGQIAFVLKDRVIIINRDTNTLYWSKATDPTIWAAPDGGFVKIDPQGERINCAVLLNDVIYTFQQTKTHAFSFLSDPAIDGEVRVVSNEYGAFDATTHESRVYLVNTSSIYEFVNGFFTDIAKPLDWSNTQNYFMAGYSTYDTFGVLNINSETIAISVLGDRLAVYGAPIVSPDGTLPNCMYIMNFSNKAWSYYHANNDKMNPDDKAVMLYDGTKYTMAFGRRYPATNDTVSIIYQDLVPKSVVEANIAPDHDTDYVDGSLSSSIATALQTFRSFLGDPFQWKKAMWLGIESYYKDGSVTNLLDSYTLKLYAITNADLRAPASTIYNADTGVTTPNILSGFSPFRFLGVFFRVESNVGNNVQMVNSFQLGVTGKHQKRIASFSTN